MLTASRLTSHSHGPGSVSSKSLRSNTKPALRRREHSEIRQVRIAAALHGQPRPRCRRKVVRHDQRSAAIERERRDEHPPVANRHQLRNPRRRLTLKQPHRVGTVRRRHKLRVPCARNLVARRLAARNALGDRQMRHHEPGLLLTGSRCTLRARGGGPVLPTNSRCGRHAIRLLPSFIADDCCRHPRRSSGVIRWSWCSSPAESELNSYGCRSGCSRRCGSRRGPVSPRQSATRRCEHPVGESNRTIHPPAAIPSSDPGEVLRPRL